MIPGLTDGLPCEGYQGSWPIGLFQCPSLGRFIEMLIHSPSQEGFMFERGRFLKSRSTSSEYCLSKASTSTIGGFVSSVGVSGSVAAFILFS